MLGKDYINKVDFDSAVYSPCGKDTVLNFGSDVRVNNANNKNGFGAIGTDSIQFRQVSLGSVPSDNDSANTPLDSPLELEGLLIFNCTFSLPGASVDIIFMTYHSVSKQKINGTQLKTGRQWGWKRTVILRSYNVTWKRKRRATGALSSTRF